MKKIVIPRFGGPEVLELVDVPTPKLKPDDVLVQAHTIGVGWPDVLVRTGTYPWMHLFPMPATPGIEMTGTVAAVGSEVTRFAIGQPAYVSSGMLGLTGACYAEARVVPQDRLIPLPKTLSLVTAANIGYYLLGGVLLTECARGQDVKRVMISGASGGVGTALVQLAKAAGHSVIATVGQESKRAHTLAMGADYVLNYREESLRQRVKDVTGGAGVDLWLEAYAGPRLAEALYCMAPWGKIVLYNAVGGHPTGSFFDDWRANMGKCISIEYFSMHVWEDDIDARRRQIERTIEVLASGKVKPPPGTFFPLAQAAQAHRLLESGRNIGRIFLQP